MNIDLLEIKNEGIDSDVLEVYIDLYKTQAKQQRIAERLRTAKYVDEGAVELIESIVDETSTQSHRMCELMGMLFDNNVWRIVDEKMKK